MSVEMLTLDLEKRFGDFSLALKAALPLEGVTAICGPSGSGKSSLLRLIAGLERLDHGFIKLGEAVWSSASPSAFLPPHKRGVGYVFQGARLLPHISVAGNLAYADKRARHKAQPYGYNDILEAFDLGPLTHRKPDTLSGGERQRVALAQALLTRPRLLLLDEPLSALDEHRKHEILPYLARLRGQFALPMLYVSHDITEVTGIADRALMLENGKSVAFGETVETLNTYGFAVEGSGRSRVILTGKAGRTDTRLQLVDVEIGEATLKLPLDEVRPIGAQVRIIINARDVSLSVKPPVGLSIQNVLPGKITAIETATNRAVVSVSVQIGDTDLPVRLTRAAIEALSLQVGMPVFALVKTASLAR